MKYNLSEILDNIKNRRTIYPENFSDRIVHKEVIEDLLNAAIWAPTHRLTQPWRFNVFLEDGREKLSQGLSSIYQETTDEIDQDKLNRIINRPLKSSAIVAVCYEIGEKVPEWEEQCACACAIQNMHLVATAYGLGGFWSTPKFLNSPQMHEFLALPDNQKCLGLFFVGYPDMEKWPKSRRKPIEYLTNWIDK